MYSHTSEDPFYAPKPLAITDISGMSSFYNILSPITLLSISQYRVVSDNLMKGRSVERRTMSAGLAQSMDSMNRVKYFLISLTLPVSLSHITNRILDILEGLRVCKLASARSSSLQQIISPSLILANLRTISLTTSRSNWVFKSIRSFSSSFFHSSVYPTSYNIPNQASLLMLSKSLARQENLETLAQNYWNLQFSTVDYTAYQDQFLLKASTNLRMSSGSSTPSVQKMISQMPPYPTLAGKVLEIYLSREQSTFLRVYFWRSNKAYSYSSSICFYFAVCFYYLGCSAVLASSLGLLDLKILLKIENLNRGVVCLRRTCMENCNILECQELKYILDCLGVLVLIRSVFIQVSKMIAQQWDTELNAFYDEFTREYEFHVPLDARVQGERLWDQLPVPQPPKRPRVHRKSQDTKGESKVKCLKKRKINPSTSSSKLSAKQKHPPVVISISDDSWPEHRQGQVKECLSFTQTESKPPQMVYQGKSSVTSIPRVAMQKRVNTNKSKQTQKKAQLVMRFNSINKVFL